MSLELIHTFYTYTPDKADPKYAVSDVSLTLNKGEFVEYYSRVIIF